MSEYSTKSVMVYDLGSFCQLAPRLARSFSKVFYYCPGIESSFPTWNNMLVGKGLPGVEKVKYWQDVIDDVDLCVFPDILSAPVQLDFLERGKRVWGARNGDELELHRDVAKQHFKKIGLSVGNYEVVTGMTSLRHYLKEHKDVFVKTSVCRGDCESFHSPEYKHVETRLDDLEHSLGAKKNSIEFVVEDAIPDCIEIACDAYSIDGEFPNYCSWGIESKGQGYIGRFTPYSQMPHQLRDINEALAPTLEKYQYRGWGPAVETRIDKKGTPWILDPSCRQTEPPGSLLLEWYSNLAEIMWEGADGKLVDPVPQGKWGAELIIQSDYAAEHWQPVDFPKEIEHNVKLRFATMIDDRMYCVPGPAKLSSIGAVVATSDTMDGAIEKVSEIAGQIQGYGISTNPECLQAVKKDFNRLKDYGITA